MLSYKRWEAALLFTAHHDGREVVFVWNHDGRCSVVLVDGQLAASTRPAVAGGRVSKGVAAKQLDLVWLEGEIESVLDGVGSLRKAMTPRTPKSDAWRGPRLLAEPDDIEDGEEQLEIWASVCGSPPWADRHLAGLRCSLCGEPMIVRAPAVISDRFVCPVCSHTQYTSAALMIALILSKMRGTLDGVDQGLPAYTRSALDDGFEQLERLEQALSGLGAEE